MNHSVVRLAGVDADQVVDVFCDAFRAYPVFQYVLDPEVAEYEDRLRKMIGFFVAARAVRDEPLLGVTGSGRLGAAATVSFPENQSECPALNGLRERVWSELGADARARYEACGQAWSRMGVGVPHVHLNMIGVRQAARGNGLARVLLDEVHRIARDTPGSRGVTLTTEDPANVALYRYFGYEVVGTGWIAADLQTWSLFRPN